jgi:hypothetical protein
MTLPDANEPTPTYREGAVGLDKKNNTILVLTELRGGEPDSGRLLTVPVKAMILRHWKWL